MIDLFNFEKIKNRISEYVQIKLELLKLEITEHVASILAQAIAHIVILLTSGFVISLLSFGLSLYLNEVLGSNFAGFFITAGIFLLVLLIISLLLKSGKLKSFFEVIILTNTKKNEDENK